MCAPSVLYHSPLGGLLVAAHVARKPLPTFTPPLAGVRLPTLAGVSNGPDLGAQRPVALQAMIGKSCRPTWILNHLDISFLDKMIPLLLLLQFLFPLRSRFSLVVSMRIDLSCWLRVAEGEVNKNMVCWRGHQLENIKYSSSNLRLKIESSSYPGNSTSEVLCEYQILMQVFFSVLQKYPPPESLLQRYRFGKKQ